MPQRPVSKTDFLLWRECPKNAWLKKHEPDVFYAQELTDFDKAIIETGNEVEREARKLFPTGVLIEGRDEAAQARTQELIAGRAQTIFQPVFVRDGFLAAVDVLRYDAGSGSYHILEIKASNEVKKDWHPHDLAFQVILLRRCGLSVSKAFIMHLNPEYVRHGELDLARCFVETDLTGLMVELIPQIEEEMGRAKTYLDRESEPDPGMCDCIYKTRSNHCTTFAYSNPKIPEYGVHDISRISQRKLTELVDSGIFLLEHVPEDFELSEKQKNQVDLAARALPLIRTDLIKEELDQLSYPLYFLDYETFACALPRFDGYGTYSHIPFQYSLHILERPGQEPIHKEFLHIGADDPTPHFARAMQEHIGPKGSIIVWYKPFECGRNREIALRLPHLRAFYDDVNARVYDLRDIFVKQHYVHKGFKGKTSIKKVLPILAPGFSYKELAIREGGTASQKWNEAATGMGPNGPVPQAERDQIARDLKEYCKLDTYAMYAIWKHLHDLIA